MTIQEAMQKAVKDGNATLAYNDGDGDQTGQPQAQHSPLPSNWHDCDIAEKQIKQLQRTAAQLAEALREFVRVMEHPKTTVAMPHTVAKARKALARWESEAGK